MERDLLRMDDEGPISLKQTIECQSCHNDEGEDLHTCPYKCDINGDYETLCNCCEDCQGVCADSI